MHGSFPTPNITSTTSTQEVANPFSIDRLIAKWYYEYRSSSKSEWIN